MRLQAQMQAYAACDDPEIRAVVRNGFGDLVAYAQRVSGLPAAGRSRASSPRACSSTSSPRWASSDGAEAWSTRLLDGCGKHV